ncbi:diguanylate cyclase/phosphodiesterase (GGDEF & EAL domains) with PAS/PAC sensor(s) [Halanaerobium saccharolyticum subsp. saccharolyticum DSM 6643]|uniref:Diguanylate cyclase/phosphodiesterase (GGDEF & EAL domains) with PAS/PAC sensor(S) n=1 Tax=Halanaerobium saccharolyticum subsp. saccharolyticum DSM 6643 TaxID=1293054 RepID=M5DZ27_9FIRM|nr:GGDEF domain-containing phosphodiesterase [Halanaerobium saccharolyticum]CCU78537.1 diguanylate cyclase/phosphodiesterase (GGDEF & EAL domains) with PAS/PAC sensor(s) [Halanaerobium saccharolyticum subsp. saccharolyticum DSM 6643]
MQRKKHFSFLKNEIKNINIKDFKDNKFFILLNSFYLLTAVLLILSNSINIKSFNLSFDTIRGLISQIQILILLYLSLKFNKIGIVSALILNVFSQSSMIAIMIMENTFVYMPGIIAYSTFLIVIFLIYNYQQEINLKVEELEKEKEKLKHLAYYDSLTEIANREMLIKELDQLSVIAKNNSASYKLIIIDFKNFKRINESWGFEIGDYILKESANRLKNIVTGSDLIGRLGGDEFAVIVHRELTEKELNRYIRSIKRELEKPYRYDNQEVVLNSNFGISSFPQDGKNSKEIIRSADIAMYKAKNSIEKEIEFFSKHMEKEVVMNVQMEDALKKALKNQEFFLMFQPQYKTDGKHLRGFEVLLRWHSSELGTVSPAKFIPEAEKTGLIKEIGEWVIRKAIKRFNDLEKYFDKKLVLSINISVVQLTEPGFLEQVKDIIDSEGLNGFRLEFEITESHFISDQEHVIDVLYKLKDLGINIALDDFGTGYASLSHLQHIPLDILKIDKSFIDLIANNSNKEKMMVVPLIEMSHQWGIEVVAEGVETIDQLHYLEDHNCDYLQGFLFNKPLTEAQIIESF